MRIFIAIKLDDSSIESIKLALRPFYKISDSLKWVKPQNMHLTVKFLGELDENELKRVIDALSEMELGEKSILVLRFRGFSYFGAGEQIKVLWTKVDENKVLNKISKKIEDGLEEVGFKRGIKKFVPHLTVARNSAKINYKPYMQIIEKIKNKMICELKVSSIHVMKSVLKSAGPEYSIIKEIELD